MKNITLAHIIFNDEKVSLRITETPAGDVVLAGDEKSLKVCCFISALGARVKERGSETKPLAAALEFFSCYKDNPRCNADAYVNKGLVLDLDAYSEKQKNVYANLIKIKSGSIITYGELAMISGFPRGCRFVGNTMAANRFPVIIPCHRVIRAGRVLGRYGRDDEKKSMLLEHEGLHIKNKHVEKS